MSKIEYYESNKGIFIEKELIYSKAFLELGGKSPHLICILMSRRKFEKSKIRRKDIYYFTNNGKIKLSYKEMKKKYDISPYQYKRAIAELCEKGFLDVKPFYNENISGYELNFTLLDNYKYYKTEKFKTGKRIKAPRFIKSSEQKRDSLGRFIKKK